MAPEYDESFKDSFKTWCDDCKSYVNPWTGHVCTTPGAVEKSKRQLENWLGDFDIT